MLRLIGIVLSIGLADSLNPSTLGPALYMAAGPRPRHTVAQFTAGVFLVYLVGGAVFAVGPGEIVLALVPKPDQTTRQVLEVVAGAVLITVGSLLWSYRARLGEKQLPEVTNGPPCVCCATAPGMPIPAGTWRCCPFTKIVRCV